MTGRRPIEVLVLGAALGLATWFGGWWSVPVGAAVWQLARPKEPAWIAGVAAAGAWSGLLLLLQPWLPMVRLTARLSSLFHLPTGGVLLVALAYAGLLAWSAARLVRPLRGQ